MDNSTLVISMDWTSFLGILTGVLTFCVAAYKFLKMYLDNSKVKGVTVSDIVSLRETLGEIKADLRDQDKSISDLSALHGKMSAMENKFDLLLTVANDRMTAIMTDHKVLSGKMDKLVDLVIQTLSEQR